MILTLEDNRMRAASFIKVIDGDTFEADIALAATLKPKPFIRARVRVAGWDAAELRDVEGPLMRDMFDVQLRAAKAIRLRLGGMSFERIVCDVYLDDVQFLGMLVARLRQLRAERP